MWVSIYAHLLYSHLAHPNDIENLLKFADMVRTIRPSGTESVKTNRLSGASASPGRIPLAVMSGIDYLKVMMLALLQY